LAMAPQGLFALSGLPSAARRARRIQRQVHDQSDGAARELARHARGPRPRKLPQLLLSARALAVQRRTARALRGLDYRGREPIMRVQAAIARRPRLAGGSPFAVDVPPGPS